MNSPCPICGGSDCVTYPLMLTRWAEGRDREHWRLIHDRLNDPAPLPSPDQFADASKMVPSIPPAEVLALIRRAEACEHRTSVKDAGCGCIGRCDLGKGRSGIVNHQECIACLRESDDHGDASPGAPQAAALLPIP